MAPSLFGEPVLLTVWFPSFVVATGIYFINASFMPMTLLLPPLFYAVAYFLIDDLEEQERSASRPKAKLAVQGNGTAEVSAFDSKRDPNAALDPKEFQKFKLTEKTVVSHNVAIYRFALHHPEQILGLPIGQHMSLAATVTDAEGKPKEVMRSYTPISSDENKGYFDLMIKAYPQGNISRHMSTLKVGDSMKVRGPKGAMIYTPGLVKRFGMIAGGTGITPMLQIIRAVIRGRPRNGGSDTTEIDLLFANVNQDDILLRDELATLVKEDQGKFRVYHVLNNAPEKWDGGVGFVTADMIKSRLPPPSDDMKLLICGPPPMVKAMKGAAESLGFEKARPISRLSDQVFCF